MSAISKPQNTFTNSLTPNVVIPTEYVQSVDAITVPPLFTASDPINGIPTTPPRPAQYALVFTIVYPDSFTKTISIPFATAAAMNTSLANYKTANATAIA